VAGQGQVDVLTMIAVVWACAVAGDLTSFFLGRRLGRAFMVKHGAKVQITEERLETVERFFDRHGGKAILIGRFVGLVRAVAPFMAGSSGMPLRRFVPYDVIGAGLWGTTFVVLGYVFWQSFSELVDYAKKGALALGAVIVLVVAIVWAVRWVRDPATGRRCARGSSARPSARRCARWRGSCAPWCARRAGPPVRVGPRDAGRPRARVHDASLRGGVGAFVFVWDLVRITQDGGLLEGDSAVLRLAERLHMDALVTAAKAVSVLGSLPVAIGLVVLAGATLVSRHRIRDALSLAAGLALTYVAVHVTKDAVDRPRPSSALVDIDNGAYPSGHAAYVMAWVAVAVALNRVLPNLASRSAFMTVAIVIAAAVGISRLYLRVHYLSDVVGGWGLGAAVFALCGTAALVIGYVRNNAGAQQAQTT
jgi:undecaprenyl-diphosphatase